MSNTDTALAFSAALTAHDLDKVAALLADDFTATGIAPAPLNKEAFLGAQRAWYAGCPDWAVTPSNLNEQGDTVTANVTITATQTGTLAFSDMPPLPPTGKKISSSDTATLTFRDGKVVSLAVTQGSPTLMEQLGLG